MRASRKFLYLTPLCALLAAGSAHATNGYFSHGYGIKAKGMGGASVTMTDNTFAGANNPAAAAWAGTRAEVGLDAFMPERSMTRTGGGLNASVDSGSNLFLIPEFGYNRAINDKLGVGITVYGNGGMNTDYPSGQINCGAGPANVLCGGPNLGVDLMQLIVAPTVAYKFNDRHSVGISPLLVFQQFKAYGLQAFDNAPGFPPMTGAPGKVTSGNYDQSTGVGVRLGYLGKLSDKFSIGASYAPKIGMSKFDDYAGLFAGGGSFDIPENYTLGASFQATPAITVALDYSRINYGGIAAISNPSNNAAPLGSANGPGFGWTDINVWKLGVQWQASTQWTLRAGLNFGDNPVQSRDVSFNILAPGVITRHLTLGGTYAMSPQTELSFFYMYAPSNSVSGTSMFDALMGTGAGGTETIKMSQQSIGIQFGWRW
ncbi:MAG: outer membrane protein transport protein [Rhodoferax sp.]|nr:outer membrane protein transport protein [Rhodoferax sp.]